MIEILRLSFFSILFLLYSTKAFADLYEIPEKNFVKNNSPVFLINGLVDFNMASRNQKSDFNKQHLPDNFSDNHFNNSQSIGNDSQFYLKTGISTGDKTKYGAVAKLEYNINSDNRNENLNLDQAFIYNENYFGKFEFGNNFAVNQKMKVGPARFARGAGGINGKYLEQINFSMLGNSTNSSSPICSGGVGGASCSNVKLPRFIMLAQSPIGHGGYAKGFYKRTADNNYLAGHEDYSAANRSRFRALKDDSFDGVEDATKISYYTPRIAGLQFGLSYAPSSSNQGVTATTVQDVDQIQINNIISFGANYSDNFENLGFAFSATAEKGKVQNSKSNSAVQRNDLSSYDIATTLTYFGFSFGASYGSWQKSLQAKNGIYSCDYNSNVDLASQTCLSDSKKFSNPYYYTVGIAYAFGPIAASITSIKSEFQKNKYGATSLGIDYKFSKDLMPYIEFTKFDFKSNQPKALDIANQNALSNNQKQLKDNSGFVFLTGILFSF